MNDDWGNTENILNISISEIPADFGVLFPPFSIHASARAQVDQSPGIFGGPSGW